MIQSFYRRSKVQPTTQNNTKIVEIDENGEKLEKRFWMSIFRNFSPANGLSFSRWGLFLGCFTTQKASRKPVLRRIEGYTFLQNRISDPSPLSIELILAEMW